MNQLLKKFNSTVSQAIFEIINDNFNHPSRIEIEPISKSISENFVFRIRMIIGTSEHGVIVKLAPKRTQRKQLMLRRYFDREIFFYNQVFYLTYLNLKVHALHLFRLCLR